jgi:glycosyltransferase involved in cell wall biosynthesis
MNYKNIFKTIIGFSVITNDMKIGFLTDIDPLDKTSWSGIYFSLFKSIEKRGFEVISIGPMKYSRLQLRLITLFKKIHFLFYRKKYNSLNCYLNSFFAKIYFAKKIGQQPLDIIFAPTSSTLIAFLNTSLPIIYLSDTSFNQIRNYYSDFSGLSSFSINESNDIERRAIMKSRYIIYPSKWAADYSIQYYKTTPAKVKVLQFGSNIQAPNKVPERNYKGRLDFLFLGVDWVRKGGEIALETLIQLKNKGYDVKLIVCGCVPPKKHVLIEVIPFLDKNIDEDNVKLRSLLSTSHFLFLPTRAECYGIVFCEAAAYGLPVITTDTGGVTSIVENGINGFALEIDASIDDYVTKIMELLNYPEKINAISNAARVKYNSELNWDIFGEKFEVIAKSLI